MISTLPLLAEFLGTFLLVLSILASGNAWVIGFTLAIIVLLVGGLSGAHVNPAVSLAMYLRGSLTAMEYTAYAAVQLLGATASLYAYQAFA